MPVILHHMTWYMFMCLPFEVLFAKFGIAIDGFLLETNEPKFRNWVYFEQIIVKRTQFQQNWVLLLLLRKYFSTSLVGQGEKDALLLKRVY